MGFPQFPSWVSNIVKNLPRSFPAEVRPSAAAAIAQDMPLPEPAAYVEEYDRCKDLSLAELAQMPMHLTDPQQRKQWCQDCLDQKRRDAAMPQPNLRALYPHLGNTRLKTDTPAENTKPGLNLLSVRDAFKRNSSGRLPDVNLGTGGNGFDEKHLIGSPLEDQARHNRETFYHSFNRLTSGGDTDTIDTPPGGGFPGFSGQIVVDGIWVAVERNGTRYPVNANWYWEQQDGDKSYYTPGDPIGWNAVMDFHIPALPTVPNLPNPKDPDDFDPDEWLQNTQDLGRFGLRALFWPADALASAHEYERDNSLGNLINLVLSGLPIVGLLGEIGKVASKLSETAGNLLRKIPGVNWLVNKASELISDTAKTLDVVEEVIPSGKVDPDPSPFQIRVDPRFPDRPDPKWSIDTRTFDSNSPTAAQTATGETRDLRQFWEQWIEMDKS